VGLLAGGCDREVSPRVRLVVPDGGVRVGAGPTCEVAPGSGWAVQRLWWEADGEPVVGDAAGPAPWAWRRDQALQCLAELQHEGTGAVEVVRSEVVVALNTPPPRPSVRLSPAVLAPRDEVRCVATSIDADGDPVTLRRTWWVGDATVDGDEVLRGRFPPGAEVRCVVEATDNDAVSGAAEATATVAGPPPGGNVLLVVLDDVGIDRLTMREAHGSHAKTPILDGLAQRGVTFTRAYAQPVCSPTRASILTGRAPHEHGLGSQTKYGEPGWTLQASEVTLPEALRDAPTPYASAAVGKWHLDRADAGGAASPLTVGGFGYFAGMDYNLTGKGVDGVDLDYFSWELNENGQRHRVRRYNTTALADFAIQQANQLPEPWFVYLAFAAAHSPLHVPPDELTHTEVGEDLSASKRFDAMLESVDTELGRVLRTLDVERRARTTVMVIADNGTSAELLRAPFPGERGKGTVYEGGVRVPLVIAGPGIVEPGRQVAHLVQASDLFATVLDLAGMTPDPAAEARGSSVSLVPYLASPLRPARRAWVMAERFEPLGLTGPYDYREQMIRDDRFKLIRRLDGARSLYDLTADPWEGRDLLAGAAAPAWRAEADRMEGLLDGALAAPVVPEAQGGGASRVAALAAGLAGLAAALWGVRRRAAA
jgi:arylsulfatase B